MRLIPISMELENFKAQLSSLYAEYENSLREDRPFHYTRKIFLAIKMIEQQRAKLERELLDFQSRSIQHPQQ